MKEPRQRQSGFTLIEIAVVVIIIGLIIGGIFAGFTMKRSAQLQSISTDVTKYVEAAKQFKEKYGYLPGDFPNATSYWGTDSHGCPDASNPEPMAATCNGDGSGNINSDGSGVGASNSYETFRAWQQLADADMIEGVFSGTYTAAGQSDHKPGRNDPTTRMPSGGYEWTYFDSGYAAMSPSFLNLKQYQQYMLVGAVLSGSSLLNPLLTPRDALSLDQKMDDGVPGLGLVTGPNTTLNSSTPCVTTDVVSTSKYNVAQTAASCILLFEVDW